MEKNQPLVEIRDVTKVYRIGEIEVHALRGVSLQICPGLTVVGQAVGGGAVGGLTFSRLQGTTPLLSLTVQAGNKVTAEFPSRYLS